MPGAQRGEACFGAALQHFEDFDLAPQEHVELARLVAFFEDQLVGAAVQDFQIGSEKLKRVIRQRAKKTDFAQLCDGDAIRRGERGSLEFP